MNEAESHAEVQRTAYQAARHPHQLAPQKTQFCWSVLMVKTRSYRK